MGMDYVGLFTAVFGLTSFSIMFIWVGWRFYEDYIDRKKNENMNLFYINQK